MPTLKKGKGVIFGANVQLGDSVAIWNYVVIGDNARIGDRTCIGSFCDIGKNVEIGSNCNIQAHVTISNGCILGDNVFIAPSSTLLNDKYPKSSLLTPPIVKDNVIIGGGVTVLPNVVLGNNCVIGGGSVVAESIPSGKVAIGVPAREIMSVEEYNLKRETFIKEKRKVHP